MDRKSEPTIKPKFKTNKKRCRPIVYNNAPNGNKKQRQDGENLENVQAFSCWGLSQILNSILHGGAFFLPPISRFCFFAKFLQKKHFFFNQFQKNVTEISGIFQVLSLSKSVSEIGAFLANFYFT